jgi:arginyl-tRNA--protein-N-Asp/Glu arginylyltransferase
MTAALFLSQAMKRSPCLRYYDMNFYVHQCSRMSYKREYIPSEIACPTLGCWVPLDDVAVAKLDADKYVHNHGDPFVALA